MLKRRRDSKFDSFDLQIWKTAEHRYRAQVVDPEDAGVAQWEFGFRLPDGPEVQEFPVDAAADCRDLSPIRTPTMDVARTLGTRLFEAAFGGGVLAFWHLRLLRSQKAGSSLRLRLHLNTPELWNWPWEQLCDPDRGFLAVHPQIPVVRYVEMAGHIPPLRVRPPVRVLAVTASPSGMSPVGVEEELQALEASLETPREADWVDLAILRNASRKALRERLQEGEFHVLHFIGHGAFDTGGEEGVIFLEKEDGSPDRLNGSKLSSLLAQPRLRLVILNVCSGARGRSEDPFASLAQSLVQARLPAVIAMQSAVTDRAATAFARHFYESLAQRKPVDRAVTDARHAMFFLGSGEWGSPVLAMRAPDGRILVPVWWEVVIHRFNKFLKPWRQALVVLLLLLLVAFGFWGLARRWFDPNLLFAFSNPEECPSPRGIPIAFVKVEPAGRPSYCLSRFEVTQRIWRAIEKVPTRRRGDALPVVRVSWDDVRSFLEKLRQRPGKGSFRLPSAAEWGYAARAGRPRAPEPPLPQEANCDNKEETDGYEGLAPVGSFPPNVWGLFDMAGNVSEWVNDRDRSGTKRLRRGGSYEHIPKNCAIQYSAASKTGAVYYDVGFRIVRDPLPAK